MNPDPTLADAASEIMGQHRIMAISTVRPDGWPQTTFVGFANRGIDLYFLVSPASQKFRNLKLDPRIALAIGEEPPELSAAKAVYAGAIATELADSAERDAAWQQLITRHPNLADYQLPEGGKAAIFHATIQHLSVLDYSKGLGHTETQSLTRPEPGSSEPTPGMGGQSM